MLAHELILQYYISWKIDAENVLELSSTRKEIEADIYRKIRSNNFWEFCDSLENSSKKFQWQIIAD